MAVDDEYTKALLHFDGTDGSSTIIDESGKTWTRSGDGQLDTAQYKFSPSSLLLDGTVDDVYTADHADWFVGSDDGCVDFWVRFNALPATDGEMSLWGQLLNGSNYVWGWVYDVSGVYGIVFQGRVGGSIVFTVDTGAVTLNTNTWYHFAFIKDGDYYRIYLDGTEVGSSLDTDDWANIVGDLAIGNDYAKPGVDYLNGWMDEFRFSNGVPRWTANFTPPTAPYGPPEEGRYGARGKSFAPFYSVRGLFK